MTYLKYVFAREFNFTPSEVEEMDARDVDSFLVILREEAKQRELRG